MIEAVLWKFCLWFWLHCCSNRLCWLECAHWVCV